MNGSACPDGPMASPSSSILALNAVIWVATMSLLHGQYGQSAHVCHHLGNRISTF